MNRLEKLNALYDYARSMGYCVNRKTFAEYLGINESSISRAFSENDYGYLTDKFLLRVNKALNNAFNPSWLLYGEGEMLSENVGKNTNSSTAPVCQNNGNNVTQQAGAPLTTIDALLSELRAQRDMADKQIEASSKQIDRLLSIIEKITNNQ